MTATTPGHRLLAGTRVLIAGATASELGQQQAQ